MLVTALLGAALAAAAAADDVHVLTDSNFDAFIAEHPISLVEFYAPWCGHCKNLEKPYAEAAGRLRGAVPLAKVDATEETGLAQRFEVRGYPTLKVFRDGKPYDYNGPRDAPGIVSYMRKESQPSFVEAATVEAVEKHLQGAIERSTMLVVGRFADADGAERAAFVETANRLRDLYVFAVVTDKAILEHYEFAHVSDNEVVILSNFDDPRVRFTGDSIDGPALDAFITANNIPLVGILTADNARIYFERNLPLLSVYFPLDVKRDPSTIKYFKNRVRKIAQDFKDQILFVLADSEATKDQMVPKGLMGTHGIGIDEFQSNNRYGYTEPIKPWDMAAVRAWVQQYVDGELEPYIKSEPIPEPNDDPVKVAVRKNFDDLVMDPSVAALVEFYAPWCGHCKNLAPKYEELAAKMADVDNLRIVKFDATANDLPHPDKFAVKGYPTLYWKPAGPNPAIVKYEGEREAAAMESFIKKEMGLKDKKKKKKGKDEL